MIRRHRQLGFTLLELTIVLVIMALLTGGLLAAIPVQQDLQNQAAGERQLMEARDALLGFAAANGYLPCPAKSSSDGTEDRTAGTCTGGKRAGLLPWVSLGTARTDPWGRLIRYSVTPGFTGSGTYFTLASAGDILVRTRDGGSPADLTKPAETVAVLWSTGKNGHWGWQPGNAAQNSDTTGPNDDEDTNSGSAATGALFMARPPSPASGGSGEFDDITVWLPRSILFNRMIAAGRLP
jgi:prepilin-type N-terminal cleavage/methylation domain-containing protein